MRLKPVENPSEPDYPDYGQFHRDRRAFLKKLGAVAGAVLAGQFVTGCDKPQADAGPVRGADAPPGEVPPPQPDPQRLPGEAPAPQPLPPRQVPPPEEHLRGKIAVPRPIQPPPEPRIAGGVAPVEPPKNPDVGEDDESGEEPEAPPPPK